MLGRPLRSTLLTLILDLNSELDSVVPCGLGVELIGMAIIVPIYYFDTTCLFTDCGL